MRSGGMVRCARLLFLMACLLSGCAGSRDAIPPVTVLGEFGSHCAPTTDPPQERAGGAPSPGTEASPTSGLDAGAVPSLSPRAWQMAEIVGIAPFLSRIPRLKEEAAVQGDPLMISLLKTRRTVSDRLLLALIETGSIAAELDCERARAEELAVRLEEVQNDIQHSRTIRAIVGEASLQMAAGVLLIAGMPAVAGGFQLVGNANALGHGVAALGGEQESELSQARSLLGELWEGPEHPRFFPTSVWRFLNQPAKEGADTTRREAIVSVWRGRLGQPGSEEEERQLQLFFGNGGVYRVEELRHRADMLGLLKAFVNLMNQELNLLMRETLVLLNR